MKVTISKYVQYWQIETAKQMQKNCFSKKEDTTYAIDCNGGKDALEAFANLIADAEALGCVRFAEMTKAEVVKQESYRCLEGNDDLEVWVNAYIFCDNGAAEIGFPLYWYWRIGVEENENIVRMCYVNKYTK